MNLPSNPAPDATPGSPPLSEPDLPNPAEQFSDREIALATSFRESVAPQWTVAAGQFVFDPDGRVNKPSPFQTGVYFVLNYPYFVTLMGGLENFRAELIWLPTWTQARRLAIAAGLSPQQIVTGCLNESTIKKGSEREKLYELIAEHFGLQT